MTQVVRARFATCTHLITALVCASAAVPAAAEPPPDPSGSEAGKFDAAKQHPVAQPEPRPLYPDEQPPPREQREPPALAPAPRAPAAPAPTPAPRTAQPVYPGQTYPTEGDAGDEPVVAPYAPPPPRQETVLVAPDPGYVWAPGYWYWYGGSYVWIGGAWVPPRPGYVYVGARWIHGYNGWAFSAGGWSVGGGVVVYPMYSHRYLWGQPYYGHYYGRHYGRHYGHHGHPHHGHYRHGGGAHYAPGYRYSSSYRRNAPPAYRSRPSGVHHHVTPRHSAPRAYYPRGASRAVHVRPRR
jgi:hypothetical protein